MVVALKTVEIFIPQSQSLKDKRQVLRHIKDKVRANFNVSVAEVDFQDKWQRATLAFVTVGSKREEVDGRLDEIMRLFYDDTRVEVAQVESAYL